MSTAFYPTNMRQQSSGGYSNHSTKENMAYVTWKGRGLFSNPTGIRATHIRPLTNNDPGNMFPTGFGLPRPIKHYRKGKTIAFTNEIEPVNEQINYNLNRAVRSSLGTTVGGNIGGGVIADVIDAPGLFVIKENTLINTDQEKCKDCNGIPIVSDWMPINNLSEKPEPNVTNGILCCNQQRKAIRRALPTNTKLSKNYFQTTYMYLQNRCQTFQQRQFNFKTGPVNKEVEKLFLAYPFVTAKILEYAKPGDPLSIANLYVAQCNPNFTIDYSIELGFVSSLSNQLLKDGLITQEQYDMLINLSVQPFLTSLKSILTPEQYTKVINYIFYSATVSAYSLSPSSPKGCSQVYYKPNNPQFATQGGVSSSTRILKLNVDTISTAAARAKTRNIYASDDPQLSYVYKDKVPQCQSQTYIGNPFFFQGQHQNKVSCVNTFNIKPLCYTVDGNYTVSSNDKYNTIITLTEDVNITFNVPVEIYYQIYSGSTIVDKDTVSRVPGKYFIPAGTLGTLGFSIKISFNISC